MYGDEEVMEPDEILAQAQDAAKAAAETLTLRQPRSTVSRNYHDAKIGILQISSSLSQIGFLRRRDDGSTSFTILNPDNDGIGELCMLVSKIMFLLIFVVHANTVL